MGFVKRVGGRRRCVPHVAISYNEDSQFGLIPYNFLLGALKFRFKDPDKTIQDLSL